MTHIHLIVSVTLQSAAKILKGENIVEDIVANYHLVPLHEDSIWGPDHEQSFNAVKALVTAAPVLAFYDVTKPTTVSADASSYGLGALLLQRHNCLWPEMEASRILDHNTLIPLINNKDLDNTPLRCQRLLMRLMRYNVKAEYSLGNTLVASYALSRCCA